MKYLGALAVTMAAVLWGLDGVVLTPRLFSLDVPFVVLLLHLIPFVIMNFFMFRQYRFLKKFSRQDFLTFFLIAFFGGFLGTYSIVNALFQVNFEHLSVVVLLQKLQPVFAIILAALILKERLTKRFVFWASLAMISSYFLAFGLHLPGFETDPSHIKAVLWSLLAAFSFGSATVFGKKVLHKYKFYTANFYRFGFTSLIMLVLVPFLGEFAFFEVTQMQWITFLIIAFTTGSGAIFLYYWGLRRISAMVSTICELAFPLSAVLFDYLINGSILSGIQWASAIILIISIIRVSRLNGQSKQKESG